MTLRLEEERVENWALHLSSVALLLSSDPMASLMAAWPHGRMAAKWPHLWRLAVPNDARRDRSEDARLVRKGDEKAGTASCAQ